MRECLKPRRQDWCLLSDRGIQNSGSYDGPGPTNDGGERTFGDYSTEARVACFGDNVQGGVVI